MQELAIADASAWPALRDRRLDVIVDPVIYRLGQIFLSGRASSGSRKDEYEEALSNDVGALVSFFDLLVLHEQLPAFNYTSTFDMGLNFDDSLGAVVNSEQQIVVPVDVQWEAYSTTKTAAIDQFRQQMSEGPFVPERAAQDILASIRQIEYSWEPNLEGLEAELPDAE